MPKKPTRRCPECGSPQTGSPAAKAAFPFCSPRCKQLDLARWLDGAYRVDVIDQRQTPSEGEH